MNADLKDKTFLITGASGGIGLATARLFSSEEATVIAHYRHNEKSINHLGKELGEKCFPVQAELSDEAQVDEMYRRALSKFPRIDGIVVNAGAWSEPEQPLHEISLERWQNSIDANLTSAFLTCRGFMKHLAEVPRESASIVLVSSTAGIFGEAGHTDYAAAKAAMAHGMTLSLKNEIIRLAPRGRVNCVCPGWTDTPMAARGMDDPELMAKVFSTMPLKKVGQPEDVASLIAFYSSEKLAGHLSGSIHVIAGGMEGRMVDGGEGNEASRKEDAPS